MKKIFFYSISILFLFACKDAKKESKINAIKDSEKKLMANIQQMDKKAAAGVIAQYDDFIAAYPKDTLSANMMFKAGDLSRGIGEYGKAIKYWGDLRESFPTYRLTPDAMFLQAFTYENDLGDNENAKRYFEKFVEKFPTHELADDAKKELEVMDIPLDELVKRFKEQNKQDVGQ